MQKTIIIIPCYNEEKRIDTGYFSRFVAENPELHLVFVNDGSKDKTLVILDQIKNAGKNNVSIITYEKNKGKAEAIRYAVNHCLDHFVFDYIGYFDADLSTSLENVHVFRETIKNAPKKLELVAGSRIKRMGAKIQRKKFRHVAGRIFASFASMLLQMPIYDTQCGAKIFSRDIAQKAFQDKFSSRWFFDVELFARLIINKGYSQTVDSIFEVPLEEWKDLGDSKISLRDYVIMPLQMAKLYFIYYNKIKQKVKENGS